MGVLIGDDPKCENCGDYLFNDGSCEECLRQQTIDAYWKEYERNAWLTSPNNDGRSEMFVKKDAA